MSEPDGTGYRESPDTTDGPVDPGGEQIAGAEGDGEVALTTDAEAQREDSVLRPGNAPD